MTMASMFRLAVLTACVVACAGASLKAGAGNVGPSSYEAYTNPCVGYTEGSLGTEMCERKTPPEPEKGPAPPEDPPCPTPLSTKSIEQLQSYSRAKLRACPSSQFEQLRYEQVEALEDNSLMMEKSVGDPVKLANLIERSEQYEVDQVPWEHVADHTDADVFNALSADAVKKMPSERLLPHLSESEFEKVDVDKLLSGMTQSQSEDMPWQQIGYKMTPKQMSEISPDNVNKMQYNKMWEYMDRRTLNKVTPEQMAQMSPKQLGNLNERAIANLPPPSMAALQPSTVAGLDSSSKLFSITPAQARAMSATNPDIFGEMSPLSLSKMDPFAIKQLSPEAINSIGNLDTLSTQQLAQIKPSTIDAVDPSVVNKLDLSTLEKISSSFN